MRSSIWAVLGLLVLSSAPALAAEVVVVVPRDHVTVVRETHRERRSEARRERERRERVAHARAERRERRQRERAERAERRERERHETHVVVDLGR
jgi:hypothetical protein